jgi:FkbM family methyltransferase
LKSTVKKLLQRLLGFDRYLRVFAKYKVRTLRSDRNEGDFFIFLSLLEGKGLLLDIGANLGIMTWHLLNRFKHAEIWAFEPIPENHKVLKTITRKFHSDRFRIFSTALGAAPGTTKMVMPEIDDVQMQGLSHVVHDSIAGFDDGKSYQVEVTTLDQLVEADKKVEGIKLDVENFEYYVLKGGQKLIERDKPIIYTELWDNENRQKCMEFLKDKGYTVYYSNSKGLKPFENSDYKGQNFFFLPD